MKKKSVKESKAKSIVRESSRANAKRILEKVLPTTMQKSPLSDEEKIEVIKKHFSEIMKTLGLDLNDDSLQDTPKRVAKMFVKEIFSGLNDDSFPKLTLIDNKMKYDQMILIQDIKVMSFCEHHFLPIDGLATVAYVPNKKVIGLSKLNRIVNFFSRRPQVQERLTKQIADCMEEILETPHIAVHINAKHYCVISRGIQDINSTTSTADLRGDFKNSAETRTEFLKQCKLRG